MLHLPSRDLLKTTLQRIKYEKSPAPSRGIKPMTSLIHGVHSTAVLQLLLNYCKKTHLTFPVTFGIIIITRDDGRHVVALSDVTGRVTSPFPALVYRNAINIYDSKLLFMRQVK